MSRSSSSPSTTGHTDRKTDLLVQRQSSWSRTLARYVEPELDLTLHGQSAPLRTKSGSKQQQTVVVPGSDIEMAFVGSYQPSWRQYDSGQITPRLHGRPVIDAASKLVHINTLELDVTGGSNTYRTRRRNRLDADGGDGSPGDTPRYGDADPFTQILADVEPGGPAISALSDEHGQREYVSISNRMLPQGESTVNLPDGLSSFTDTNASSSSLVSLAGSTAVTTTNHWVLDTDTAHMTHRDVRVRCRPDDNDEQLDSTTEHILDEFVPQTPVVEVTRTFKTNDTDVDAGGMTE